jgi:hypothetical protein
MRGVAVWPRRNVTAYRPLGQFRLPNGEPRDRRVLLDSGLNISSFGEDAQRELYVTAFDGKVYRFE